MNVEHFMTKDLVTCRTSAKAREAAELMKDRNVGFLVVTDDQNRVVGVLTDRQLALRCLTGDGTPDTSVENVMTNHPATASIEDNMLDVAGILEEAGSSGVRRVPVVDREGKAVGVVSTSDLAVVAHRLVDVVLGENVRHAVEQTQGLRTGGERMVEAASQPREARSAWP